MVPAVAVKLLTVTGTPSGLLHVQLIATVAPAGTLAGEAEQEIVGGFFGGSFMVNVLEALASLFFFAFGSVTLTVAVQFPPGAPVVSMLAVSPLPVILPQVLVQSYFRSCFGLNPVALAVAVSGSPTIDEFGCTLTLAPTGVTSG
jgi:hypothetical protein